MILLICVILATLLNCWGITMIIERYPNHMTVGILVPIFIVSNAVLILSALN